MPNNLDRVRDLGLDSLEAGYRVFYSDGYAERAADIGNLVSGATRFYRDKLGIEVKDLSIALLDPADYESAAFPGGYPYGIPFAEDLVIVHPADLSQGLVRDVFSPYEKGASPRILARLGAAGCDYAGALPIMFDAISLHEIGHVLTDAYSLDTRQAWFNEFMATYFGYIYMRDFRPEMALVWDVVMEVSREGYQPAHSSLDDLNNMYTDVGLDNYIWYQNVIQDRVHVVCDLHGIEFIRKVKQRLDNDTSTFDTAIDLVSALDEIAPGFKEWSVAYENKV